MSKPAVVFGGPSPEHDISILTGLQAARALGNAGVEVEAIYWTKSGEWFVVDGGSEAIDFAEGVPAKARRLQLVTEAGGGFMFKRRRLDLSVVVNCCHGGPGEDGSLQAAFDLAGVRYTGPGAAASALGMDKLAFGGVMEAAGLRTLPRVLVAADVDPGFPGPYIVKPRFGGSSIGIEVVEDVDTARALAETSPLMRDGAVVEPFLEDGRDCNVAVRTFPELQLSAIEAPRRDVASAGIYSYTQKYLEGGGLEGSARELPAALPAPVEARIRETALRIVDLVGVRGVARIDFLRRGEELWVNEINTIPGSLAAYLWIDPPIPRHQLLLDMIEEGSKQPSRQFVTVGADGTALRSAASIAAKLG